MRGECQLDTFSSHLHRPLFIVTIDGLRDGISWVSSIRLFLSERLEPFQWFPDDGRQAALGFVLGLCRLKLSSSFVWVFALRSAIVAWLSATLVLFVRLLLHFPFGLPLVARLSFVVAFLVAL